MQELCRLYRPEREPSIEDWDNAWLDVGPFKSRHAAQRNLREFEQAYLEFAEEKFPGLTVAMAAEKRLSFPAESTGCEGKLVLELIRPPEERRFLTLGS